MLDALRACVEGEVQHHLGIVPSSHRAVHVVEGGGLVAVSVFPPVCGQVAVKHPVGIIDLTGEKPS